MYFSGTVNVSSFGTQLNSRFVVMTIDEVTLDRPSLSGLQRHLLVLPVETLLVSLEFLH